MPALDLKTWLTRYKKSWEELDTELFLSLFTQDATYQSHPFDKPAIGAELRGMWDSLKTRQSGNHIELHVLGQDGDTTIVRWMGQTTRPDRGRVKGDGLFVLRFAKDGRCQNLREWQHWIDADAQPTKGLVENP
ncbi:MAG: nuclear transport factor 2 family protein [Alphaproteobacteria bacterium]|nr:nuclear transport factor 2 family protein [Alphaproteobacteria bacterium]